MTYARRLRAPFSFVMLAAGALSMPHTAIAQQTPASITVELGDVSLTKLPFIMAADYGIYERNALKVRQYITPSAAKAVEARGVKVPPENIGREEGNINIGGGSRARQLVSAIEFGNCVRL